MNDVNDAAQPWALDAPRALVLGIDAPLARPGLEFSSASSNPGMYGVRFEYAVPRIARVTVTVHDVQGRRVATLVDADRAAGRHATVWKGTNAAGARVLRPHARYGC